MYRKVTGIARLVAAVIWFLPVTILVCLIWAVTRWTRQRRRTKRLSLRYPQNLSQIRHAPQIMRALEAWCSGTQEFRHRKESLLDGGMRIEASGRSVEFFSEFALGVSLEFSETALDERWRYLHGIIVEATDRTTQPRQQRIGTVCTEGGFQIHPTTECPRLARRASFEVARGDTSSRIRQNAGLRAASPIAQTSPNSGEFG